MGLNSYTYFTYFPEEYTKLLHKSFTLSLLVLLYIIFRFKCMYYVLFLCDCVILHLNRGVKVLKIFV